jgi:hypothetical protein
MAIVFMCNCNSVYLWDYYHLRWYASSKNNWLRSESDQCEKSALSILVPSKRDSFRDWLDRSTFRLVNMPTYTLVVSWTKRSFDKSTVPQVGVPTCDIVGTYTLRK